jgi:hypothetical protein
VAVDELDVLMWFIRGGLYFEADPDVLHERYPMSPAPTKRDRALFKREVPTRVATLTDDLDAWMYYEEGISGTFAPKPVRVDHPAIERLVTFLEDEQKPGWLRFGAELLNLSSEAQESLSGRMSYVVKATRYDHSFHSAVEGFPTPWGYALLFIASQPQGNSGARNRLSAYMTAKKYQLQADRALGILVNEEAEIIAVNYQNDPYEPNDELDNLVAEMRLLPPTRMTRTIPPCSSGPRTQRNGRKSKKKRK